MKRQDSKAQWIVPRVKNKLVAQGKVTIED